MPQSHDEGVINKDDAVAVAALLTEERFLYYHWNASPNDQVSFPVGRPLKNGLHRSSPNTISPTTSVSSIRFSQSMLVCGQLENGHYYKLPAHRSTVRSFLSLLMIAGRFGKCLSGRSMFCCIPPVASLSPTATRATNSTLIYSTPRHDPDPLRSLTSVGCFWLAR